MRKRSFYPSVTYALLPAMGAAALLLSACGDEPIRSEETSEPLGGHAAHEAHEAGPDLPRGHPPLPMPGQVDMAQQQLPAAAVTTDGAPAWAVPPHWQPQPLGNVRRGSWTVQGPDGQTGDVSVTAFPGDVGGMLQNVNRWRRQVGLLPVTERDLEGEVKPFDHHGSEGYMVKIQGETAQTIAVAIPHNGSTWFFKLTGPQAVNTQEQATFLAFVESVDFPDAE